MDGSVIRLRPVASILSGLLFSAVVCATSETYAQAQTPAQGKSKAGAGSQKDRSSAVGKADGRGTGAPGGAAGAGAAKAPGVGAGEPSAAYQESLRQTVERRRQRRARRQQNADDAAGAVGAIVPWPMPPALIIRHTREVHGEVDALFYGLRR